MTSLNIMGETLRTAYASWLRGQLSEWVSIEDWNTTQLNSLLEMDATAARFQEDTLQFAALEAWLTAGFLPPDLADFDSPNGVPASTVSEESPDVMTPVRSPDNVPQPALPRQSLDTEAPLPSQGPFAASTPFDSSSGPESHDAKAGAIQFKSNKGLRDLAAFIQSSPRESAQPHFAGSRSAEFTPSAGETVTGRTLTKSKTPDSSYRPQPGNPETSSSLRLRAGEGQGIRKSNDVIQVDPGSEGSGLSDALDAALGNELRELMLSNEQPAVYRPPLQSPTKVVDRALQTAAGSTAIKPALSDAAPTFSSKPAMDPERHSTTAFPMSGSPRLDLDAIVDALSEEIERDFKRIYGR